MKSLALLIALMLCLAACSNPLRMMENLTPTPQRPEERNAVYRVQAGDDLFSLTLERISLQEEGATDWQFLVVLADGNGDPSYLLYPANQPGIPENPADLSDYPLKLRTQVQEVGMWMLAIRHRAYPVAEQIGMNSIAGELANAFDVLQGQARTRPITTADVVVRSDPALLEWFGAVDVLGEVVLTLPTEQETRLLTQRASAADERFSFTYTTETNVSAAFIGAPLASPVADSPRNPDMEGYRRVINDSFPDGNSSYPWFSGQELNYRIGVVDGAYEIHLTGIDANREQAFSWGSLQDLYFDDYIVRARMRVLQPELVARYGLWLHYQDSFNFLFFGIENTGRYRIAAFRNGSYAELVDWTPLAEVQQGNAVNEIEVRLNGQQLIMSVNGRQLPLVSDASFQEGRIAFFCYAEGLPATCHLEHLEVWIPAESVFPIIATATPVFTPTP